jgi:GNAT superfamily N-acetyltransferase
MDIERATADQLDAVMRLFAEARAWQRERGLDVWSVFDPAIIERDIRGGRVHLAIDAGCVCGAVTLVESDVLVWGDDDGRALYLHRLVSARGRAGAGIGALLIGWCRDETRRRSKQFLRLDTWDGNPGMRAYYERHGFRHVEDRFFAPDSPLPEDYRGTYKSLYELRV